MNDKSFSLEIITPQRVIFNGEVTHVKAPGQNGYFGVLAHHEPFMTMLRPGSVMIENGKEKSEFATAYGFCTIANDKMLMLVDSAEKPKDIDVSRAEKARNRAVERLKKKYDPDIDIPRAQRALARAMNRLDVA
jgi:F-type H+-transporting ATPase subunit epsilon